MLYSGTDPDSFITEYTLVYEDKSGGSLLRTHTLAPLLIILPLLFCTSVLHFRVLLLRRIPRLLTEEGFLTNMAHLRQPRSDSRPGFLAKVLGTLKFVPSSRRGDKFQGSKDFKAAEFGLIMVFISRKFSLIGFRRPAPPQNRQLIVYYH